MESYNKCLLNPQKIERIEKDISKLKADIRLFHEQSNQRCYELLSSELRKNFSLTMVNALKDRISEDIDNNIVPVCDRHDFCKGAFNDFLSETVQLIGREKVKKETIEGYWKKLDEIRKLVDYDKCDLCFKEISKIFNNQIDVMSSLNIYDNGENFPEHDLNIPIEDVVNDICEPLANKQRLLMLRSLVLDSRSFTDLSKLTGLRGGNLLFHIQKLMDKGMILQRNERGDYIITSRGYSVFKGITEIYSSVNNRNDNIIDIQGIKDSVNRVKKA